MAKVNTRKRGKSYSYYFSIGSVGGKYKKMEKGGFETEEEAYNAGIKAYTEYVEGGSVFKPSELCVADYMDCYIENYVKMNMKANTVLNHQKMIKCHIKPDLGDYKLKSLTTKTIQEWVNGKYKRCYSYSTIDNMLSVLSSALKQAVIKFNYLKDNPAQYVTVPKAAKSNAKNVREPMSDEDMKKIFERFPFGHHYHMPILIGYYTGMRLGEVLGLTWDNIDLDHKQIKVKQQQQRIVNSNYEKGTKGTGCYYIGTTKNESSVRTIDIGETLATSLRRWRAVQASNELRYGGDYIYTYANTEYNEVVEEKILRIRTTPKAIKIKGDRINMVCTTECGDFIKATAFQHASRVARTELGLDKFDFHSLRHTHATKLVENSDGHVDYKTIADRLGHSSIETTMDTYTHTTESMKKKTVDVFERAVKGVL